MRERERERERERKRGDIYVNSNNIFFISGRNNEGLIMCSL